METILMRAIRNLFSLAALVAASFVVMPASAQVLQANPGYFPNEALEGVSVLSNTAYTNATTTATILPGTAITVPATQFDPAKRLLTACYSADATKSTGGTGAVGVALDGVPVAASYRYTSSAAGRNTASACYSFFRPSAAAVVVSLYAVSSDTNSFAVQNAQMILVQRSFN